MNYVRHRNDLQIKIVKLLIQHSDLIGVNQICKLPNEMRLAGEMEENRLQRKIAIAPVNHSIYDVCSKSHYFS